MDVQEVLKEISECFKGTALPPEDQIIDESCLTIYEALEVKKAFASLNWQEVKPTIMLQHKAAINYFSDHAFVYYLPSYMNFILTDFQRADVLVDIFIQKLTLPADTDTLKEYVGYINDKKKLVDLDEYYATEFRTIDD